MVLWPDQLFETVWCGSLRGGAGGLGYGIADDAVLDCWAARCGQDHSGPRARERSSRPAVHSGRMDDLSFRGSEAAGKRDLLEGLLIYAGLCALAVGTNVVLDFGLWGRDERSALRSLGASVGAVEESFICRLTRRLSASVSRSAFSSAQGTPSRSRTLTSLSGVPSSRNRPRAS